MNNDDIIFVSDEPKKTRTQRNNEATKKYHDSHKEQYKKYYHDKYLREREIYRERNARNYQERKRRKHEKDTSISTDIMV